MVAVKKIKKLAAVHDAITAGKLWKIISNKSRVHHHRTENAFHRKDFWNAIVFEYQHTLLDLLSRPSAWASSHLRFCYLYQRRPPSRLRQRLDNHVHMPHEGGCCRNGHMLLTTWLRVNHSAVPVSKKISKHYNNFSFHFESNFFYIDNVFMVLHGGPIENSSVLFIYAEYVGSGF